MTLWYLTWNTLLLFFVDLSSVKKAPVEADTTEHPSRGELARVLGCVCSTLCLPQLYHTCFLTPARSCFWCHGQRKSFWPLRSWWCQGSQLLNSPIQLPVPQKDSWSWVVLKCPSAHCWWVCKGDSCVKWFSFLCADVPHGLWTHLCSCQGQCECAFQHCSLAAAGA